MILAYDEHKMINSLKKTKSLEEFESLLLSFKNNGLLNEEKETKINFMIKALRKMFKRKNEKKQ
jgi:hypothetical protein